MLAIGPLREELLASGVTPILRFELPTYPVLTKARLGLPADWDALDMRISGTTQALTARALGGVGFSIPGPEVYTAGDVTRRPIVTRQVWIDHVQGVPVMATVAASVLLAALLGSSTASSAAMAASAFPEMRSRRCSDRLSAAVVSSSAEPLPSWCRPRSCWWSVAC